ncbi:MAG: hypothetical protein CMM45_02305 [Rhodospirillaceae bacterium]|nr:hypothetical protein [Rhodospirillaceae bacterium]
MRVRKRRSENSERHDVMSRSAVAFWSGGRMAVMGSVLLLAGCASVPDAVNPVLWYKDVKGVVAGDKTPNSITDRKSAEPLVADRNKPAPGADDPTPSLSTVPQRPSTSSRAERRRIERGLVAERADSRQYSGDVIRRQGESASSNLVREPRVISVPAPVPASKEKIAAPVLSTAKPTAPKLQPAAAAQARPAPNRSGQIRPSAVVPNRNPNPPKLAMAENIRTPGEESVFPQTVVVSGNGVETMSVEPAAPGVSGNSTVSGVRSLEEFDPGTLRGSYQVATILFKNGSAKLRGADKRILKKVAAQHKSMGGTLRIVGHASSRTRNLDPVKHKVVNFAISAARADAVVRELVRLGAKPSNLFVGAVSDNQPKFRETMPSGEAGNRRTDIYIDF